MPSVETPESRELSAATRTLCFAAFLAPAVLALARCAREALSGVDVAAATVLAAVAGLAWAAFVLLPSGRRLVVAMSRALLAHLGFVSLGLAALAACVLAFAKSDGSAWGAASSSLALFTLAAFVHALALDRRATLRRVGIVAINLALLAALDVAVRVFVLPSKSHNNLFIVHEPNLGWKLRPGASLTHSNEVFTAHETINSLGFRTAERPFAKPAGVKRIVVVGDSHSEAYTVDDDRTWLVLLEAELARDFPVEVISLGVGGFSTDQELLAYLHYGRRFAPDLVILQTCANDPEFNVLDHYWRGKKPLFERHGELLFLTGVPVPDLRSSGLFSRELLQFSGLALLAETIARQAAIRHDVEVEADRDEAWRVTELLIRDLAALVRADGAAFAGFDVSTKNVDEHRRFREIFARHGVPSLDVDAIYVDEWKSYFAEGHWNAKGQRAAAMALAPQVRELLRSDRATPVEASVHDRR
jgi:lysophospholipase L1-like esterase